MDAYEKALSLLAMREHTGKELSRKLSLKGYDRDETEEALRSLEEEGALSEKRFASVFIRSRMRKHPEGRQVICMRLAEKGVGRSDADEALREYWESDEFYEALKAAWMKLRNAKGYDSARIALLRRGFTEHEIASVSDEDDSLST